MSLTYGSKLLLAIANVHLILVKKWQKKFNHLVRVPLGSLISEF